MKPRSQSLRRTAVIGGCVVACLGLLHFLTFGRVVPVRRIESLKNPHRVTAWDRHGLLLDDGRRVLPQGMISLPEKSPALQVITNRGVEVNERGEVTGLMTLFHGCGNDAVKYDLRRVNVAHFLTYLGEGQSAVQMNLPATGDRRYLAGHYFGNDWVVTFWIEMNHALQRAQSPATP